MNLELEEKIKNKIDEFLKEKDLELLEFKLFMHGGRYILRCIVDFREGGVTLEDCVDLNKKIFSFIDKESLLGEDFVVEVNSPGLDRELKTYKDFLRVKNRKIQLFFKEEVGKNRYLEGELIDVKEDFILLKVKDDMLEVNLNDIKFGKEKIEI